MSTEQSDRGQGKLREGSASKSLASVVKRMVRKVQTQA